MRYPYAVGVVLDHFKGLTPEYVQKQLQDLTFVSLAKRYMYFEVPKAANTQMKELLRAAEGAPPMELFKGGIWETRRFMFVHYRPNVPLPNLLDLDDSTQKEVLESPHFLRMTLVRNPYARLLSAWRSKVVVCEPRWLYVHLQIKGQLPALHHKSFVSFEEFLGYLKTKCDLRTCDRHWRRQTDHIFLPALNFSLVAKLEQLEEGLRHFEKHVGLSPGSLNPEGRNASIRVDSGGYSQELADSAYSLYEPDFNAFGYDRNSWQTRSDRAGASRAGDEEQFILDEIVERNLVIFNLYEERDRLRVLERRVSRLGLLPVLSILAALYSVSRRVLLSFKGWVRDNSPSPSPPAIPNRRADRSPLGVAGRHL